MSPFEEAFRNQLVSSSFTMLDGEEKIVQDAVRGESSAFGLLYDHYQPKIYRFVFIKVGHREEAEDLTHQVFLQAFLNVANYTPRGFPFSSWLYRIARNQVIDYYRTKKRVEGLAEAEAKNPELFVKPVRADILLDQKLEFERILGIIRTMKVVYQDILILRFVNELSVQEVAKAMDKSEGAVKLLQYRAIKALRSALDG